MGEYCKGQRDAVIPDLREVSRTLPEFTPHDDKHISNLFELTEQLLHPGLLEALTSTEAFVLAASLVGHDWGMAVSDDEKSVICDASEMNVFKLFHTFRICS